MMTEKKDKAELEAFFDALEHATYEAYLHHKKLELIVELSDDEDSARRAIADYEYLQAHKDELIKRLGNPSDDSVFNGRGDGGSDSATVISLDEIRKLKAAKTSAFGTNYGSEYDELKRVGTRSGNQILVDACWMVDPNSEKMKPEVTGAYILKLRWSGPPSEINRNSDVVLLLDGEVAEVTQVTRPMEPLMKVVFRNPDGDIGTFELESFETAIEEDGTVRIQLWTK